MNAVGAAHHHHHPSQPVVDVCLSACLRGCEPACVRGRGGVVNIVRQKKIDGILGVIANVKLAPTGGLSSERCMRRDMFQYIADGYPVCTCLYITSRAPQLLLLLEEDRGEEHHQVHY
eukprot:GHVU01127877.1.p1 GENE.GHVU01127877.1~~GHVU01127877.1.p1  ORF type:complete len:118 (+),score=4.07 GHVU01127877.1:62-415(+)